MATLRRTRRAPHTTAAQANDQRCGRFSIASSCDERRAAAYLSDPTVEIRPVIVAVDANPLPSGSGTAVIAKS
jgi:hypothetical protein